MGELLPDRTTNESLHGQMEQTRSDTLSEISHADGRTGLTDGNCELCFSTR